MKTVYVYKDPLKNGYKRFKLSKREHNLLFKNRQIKWLDRYEYYYNDKHIILHKFYNPLCVVLNTLFFPLSVLINGVKNIKEIWLSLKSLYHQKQTGTFISDNIWNNSVNYNKVMEVIKNK